MTAVPTTGGAIPRVVFFRIPGDPEIYFARRFGRDYWAANRWRGWRLCGVQNRRAGAALVDGSQSIRVRLVEDRDVS